MRYLLLFILIGCSTPEPINEIDQTEIPDWLVGVWIPEADPDTNASFEKQQWLIDLTFDGVEYWQSHYFSFAADYDYEPLLNFEATETSIKYSVYTQYFAKELEFTVTRLNETQITVDINDGVEVFNYGVFNKL